MKRMVALMVMFTLPLFAGCLTDSNDKDSDGNGNGGGVSQPAAVYLPFKEGAVWNFSETETEYMEGSPQVYTSTFSLTCTGQQTIMDKTYWILDEEDDQMLIRIGSNGNDVYEYNYEEYIAKIGRTLDAEELPILKFGVPAGTTWEIDTDSFSGTGYSWSMTFTGKFVGLETVTTPAGTFENCVHIDMITSGTFTGLGETGTSQTTSSLWFAPNVGPVKMHDVEYYDNEKDYECIDLLTSYSIP